jgi:hypothetical protein
MRKLNWRIIGVKKGFMEQFRTKIEPSASGFSVQWKGVLGVQRGNWKYLQVLRIDFVER